MLRYTVALAVALALAGGVPAWAQTSTKPIVEVGGEFSAGPGADGDWQALGARIGVNFDARTALEVSVAPQLNRDHFTRVDYGFVQLKRSLHAFDRGSLFGTLGISQSKQDFSREYSDPFPDSYPTNYSWGPSFGFGAEVEVAPYLGLRGDVQYVLSQDSLLRFVGSATVPMGRYRDRSRALDPPELVASPAGRVRLGQTVWVTSAGGSEVKGEVVARSLQGLTIRHAFGSVAVSMPDIQKIEVTDGLGDGIAVGAITGGITGGVLGWLGGGAWCEGGAECQAFSSLLIGGLGTGVGALAGAIVDSFRDTRRPLFDAGSRQGLHISVAPVLAKRRAGIGGAISW
jgi:hypothetical protein